jgi:TFIIF-interacting CTD phosphatase-like protein
MNPDEFYPLNPDHLVRIYKREKIESFLNELHTMQETYIEEALSKSDFRDAREVLDYIRKKY